MRNLFFFLGLALFLAACQEELKYTSEGYQYEIHTDVGGPKPQPGDYVYFHVQTRNGDSVYYATRQMANEVPFLQIPLTPAENQPGSPFEEILAQMSVGDSATISIRLDTLPVQSKPPGFETADYAYQDLVVVEIKSQEEYQEIVNKQREEAVARRQAAQARFADVEAMAQKTAAAYTGNQLTDQLKSTPSGLKYIIHEEGSGAKADPGRTVEVQYYGMLTDGKMFDNSFQSGNAFQFRLGTGQVIPGWDEGIALLREGAKATLFVPAALGYGERGAGEVIPPDSELVFYVELEKVQ